MNVKADVMLDNALVRQKNAILDCLQGSTLEGIEQAIKLLDLFAPLWRATGYGYKVAELSTLIREAITVLVNQEEDYLAHCRKNCKTRPSTERDVARLKEMKEATYYL